MRKTLKLFLASVVMLIAVVGLSTSALGATPSGISDKNAQEFQSPKLRSGLRSGSNLLPLGQAFYYDFAAGYSSVSANFKTNTSSTSYYEFLLENVSVADGYASMEVRDASTNVQVGSVSNTSYGKTGRTSLKLSANKEYTIILKRTTSVTTQRVNFLVRERKADAGATKASSSAIKLGTTYKKTIAGPGDTDWYKFTTTGGTAYYHFNMKNTYGATGAIHYTIGSKEGDLYHGYSGRETFKLAGGKTYYINVKSAGTNAYGNYSFNVKRKTDSAGNSKSKAKSIKVNKSYSYGIEYGGDVDWYKFKTGNYSSIKFNITNNTYLSGASSANYGRTWASYTVYDNKGRYRGSLTMNSNNQTGTLSGKVAKNTTHYLKVQSSSYAAYGDYKITIRNPKSVSVAKPTYFAAKKASKTSVKVSWKKKSVSGYQIYYSYKKSSGYVKMKTVSKSKTSYTKKSLKKGKTYYFKMRSYKKVGSLTYYSKYTTVKKVKL